MARVIRTYKRTLYAGRWWLLATVLLFLFGAVAGYALAVARTDLVMANLTPLLGFLRRVGQEVTRSSSPIERALPIFVNNVRSVFVMLLGGVFAGVVPLIGSITNGAIVGVVAGVGARLSPLAASPWLLFLSLAPHGIFELPALWLGGAWGMKLGIGWMGPWAAGRRNEFFLQTAREAVLVFVLAALLLAVAALIEANLTLIIVRAAVRG